MVSQYNIHDAKTHLSKLVDRASAGEEIVLAKAGKPTAKIVPLRTVPTDKDEERILRTPGALKGQLDGIPDSVWFDPMSDDDLREWGML